jgi:hypothetical protein
VCHSARPTFSIVLGALNQHSSLSCVHTGCPGVWECPGLTCLLSVLIHSHVLGAGHQGWDCPAGGLSRLTWVPCLSPALPGPSVLSLLVHILIPPHAEARATEKDSHDVCSAHLSSGERCTVLSFQPRDLRRAFPRDAVILRTLFQLEMGGRAVALPVKEGRLCKTNPVTILAMFCLTAGITHTMEQCANAESHREELNRVASPGG